MWRGPALWLALAGATVGGLAVVVAASGAPGGQAFGRGLLDLLVVGLPMAAGIYALRAPLDARFGATLLVLSLAWSLTALSELGERVSR